MDIRVQIHWMAVVLVCSTVAHSSLAAESAKIEPATISPALDARLHSIYGAPEADALRSDVGLAVRTALLTSECGEAIAIRIAIVDATPTHPTRAQLAANPALDFLRSKSRGGASLEAEFEGADGRVLGAVSWRHYAADLSTISMAATPWGDAHLAIEQFAGQLAKECRKLSAHERVSASR